MNPIVSFVIVILAVGCAGGFYSMWVLWKNQHYIEIGKNGCGTRPSYTYFERCNARFDGPACSEEMTTRLMYWFDEFDTQCATTEDPRTFRFRFPVHEPEPQEMAEMTP